MERPTTPGTSTVANADSAPGTPLAGADALSDLGEHVEEHEAQKEWLDQRTYRELDLVLPQHDQVASNSGERDPAGCRRRAARRRPLDATTRRAECGDRMLPTSSPTSVAEVLSGKADEDSLQRRLGHGQVGERESPGLSRFDHAGYQSFRAAHLELDAAGDRTGLRQAFETAREGSARRSESPAAFTVTMVSAPTLRLSSAGVSRARILPWSMMATRSQSLSASSM